MAYTLESTNLYDLDLDPGGTEAEVLRNVSIILATFTGSCPGYRAFGTDYSYLDKSVLRVQPKLVREVIAAVETWEPRAEVQSVECYRDDTLGRLIPKVTLEIKEDT